MIHDPTKGYEVPNIPSDSTEDTLINYVSVPKPETPTPAQPAPSTPQHMDGQRELPIQVQKILLPASAPNFSEYWRDLVLWLVRRKKTKLSN